MVELLWSPVHKLPVYSKKLKNFINMFISYLTRFVPTFSPVLFIYECKRYRCCCHYITVASVFVYLFLFIYLFFCSFVIMKFKHETWTRYVSSSHCICMLGSNGDWSYSVKYNWKKIKETCNASHLNIRGLVSHFPSSSVKRTIVRTVNESHLTSTFRLVQLVVDAEKTFFNYMIQLQLQLKLKNTTGFT